MLINKGLISVLLISALSINGAVANNYNFNTSPTKYFKTVKIEANQTGRKTKDGRYKRKKGFMWGLFKKKSACDCPKH